MLIIWAKKREEWEASCIKRTTAANLINSLSLISVRLLLRSSPVKMYNSAQPITSPNHTLHPKKIACPNAARRNLLTQSQTSTSICPFQPIVAQ